MGLAWIIITRTLNDLIRSRPVYFHTMILVYHPFPAVINALIFSGGVPGVRGLPLAMTKLCLAPAHW